MMVLSIPLLPFTLCLSIPQHFEVVGEAEPGNIGIVHDFG